MLARFGFSLVVLAACAAVQAQPLALVHGNLVDVERRTVTSDATVVIDGDKIVAAGRAGSVRVPDGARVVDVRGKWVLPGLVDSHIHLFQSGGLYTRPDVIDLRKVRSYDTELAWVRDNAGDMLARYLATGVTTVIDIGGPLANYAIRDRFNREARSPTIFLTGPLISTRQPAAFQIEDAPILLAPTGDAARAIVKQQLPYKPDFIKIWYIARSDLPAESTLPVIQATIDEAHSHGLKVAVHATQLKTAKLALGAGADILVHSVDDAPVDDEFIALLKKRNVPYIPTLIVSRRYREVLAQQFRPTAHDLALANPFALGSLGDLQHMPQSAPQMPATATPAQLERDRNLLANLKRLAEAGVLIATGTDAGNIGTPHASSYFDELLEMQKAGLGTWDILRASTVSGARVLGKEREFGSIAAGKRADLVVLDRDPFADLRNVEAVHAVVNRGNWHEPAALIDSSPAALAQRQLNAYNQRDLEAFLEPYSEDVEFYSFFPNKLHSQGKAAMREGYRKLFESSPELHCELVNRIVLGDTVIDQERVTGLRGKTLEAIAIYTVRDGKIVRVTFI
jgi:imidazolonepropionase-like amidohydrolase